MPISLSGLHWAKKTGIFILSTLKIITVAWYSCEEDLDSSNINADSLKPKSFAFDGNIKNFPHLYRGSPVHLILMLFGATKI